MIDRQINNSKNYIEKFLHQMRTEDPFFYFDDFNVYMIKKHYHARLGTHYVFKNWAISEDKARSYYCKKRLLKNPIFALCKDYQIVESQLVINDYMIDFLHAKKFVIKINDCIKKNKKLLDMINSNRGGLKGRMIRSYELSNT